MLYPFCETLSIDHLVGVSRVKRVRSRDLPTRFMLENVASSHLPLKNVIVIKTTAVNLNEPITLPGSCASASLSLVVFISILKGADCGVWSAVRRRRQAVDGWVMDLIA